jgi:hypothetical protein
LLISNVGIGMGVTPAVRSGSAARSTPALPRNREVAYFAVSVSISYRWWRLEGITMKTAVLAMRP